ncbi:twin-arginine translocation pathway signal [Erythrobacter longus]|uniref:Twin-arginine translocation pathway signal n=2 Tax=Erythrobacter longus TaxID=1044 RepID=A0A074M748_ERYLO|nr:murein L,D-transpeptidase catalytic domain family protein [Erythrobacter longus]KEO88535.1 twin-arginine translocation pathway signal [Erythrobacter longus]
MNRRDLLKGSLATGAALVGSATLPTLSAKLAAQVPAAPRAGTSRDRALFDIAKRELTRAGDAIWRKDIVGICDYGVHSARQRFYLVNLDREEVRTMHVSHGAGSDPEHDGWLNHYSNVEGSNATSKGAYVTWEWYQGRYGTSVRLGGLDPTNDAALRRYIVMHRAAYAEPPHLERYGRMGRSNGCFAYGTADFHEILMNLSGGRLLYADSLGLQENGAMLSRDEQLALNEPRTQMLKADNPSAMQRRVPGAF